MKQVITIFALFFIIGTFVHAQPEAWTPDPAEIFAEGVEWSLVEPETYPINPIQIDNERDIIRIPIDDEWREYPFPENTTYIAGAFKRSDGLIEIRFDHDYRNVSRPGDILFLNPETGLYEQPPTVCEGRILQAEPGKWMIAYPLDDEDEAFLCHSATDEQFNILPAGFASWNVFLSQDERYFILIGLNLNEGNYHIYAYQIEEKELSQLGIIPRGLDTEVWVCDWLNNTQGFLCSADQYRSWPGMSYYAFDLTKPESIEWVFWDYYKSTLFRMDEPPRYIGLYSQDYDASISGGRGANHIPCTITTYDTSGINKLEAGYECLPILVNETDHSLFYRQGNIIYYLTVESEDATISTLRSYDAAHEAGNFEIFTGEIESILSVSPDGQYIVLMLDENRDLDFPWNYTGGCCPELGGYNIAILHEETGQIVYYSEPIGVYATGQVTWLDNKTVIIVSIQELGQFRVSEGHDHIYTYIQPSLRRISFTSHGMEAFVTNQFGLRRYGEERDSLTLDLAPDEPYWLRKDDTIINLRTFETIPLLREGVKEKYDIYTKWLEDGSLEVNISNPDDYLQSVTYKVTLPE